MENILELKTINELQLLNFYIPSYQRGYRWTSNEVKDLLDDIKDFKSKPVGNTEEKTWYCLQPIVVKLRDDGMFEVIDGQQRLTTIYLILHYLNQDFIESRRDPLFALNYQTREDSHEFLRDLNDKEKYNNVDFYHISEAYTTISVWFDKQTNTFDKGDFRSKFKFQSKVIWYQSYEEDPIAIFTRINIGKIPLTNSELIKALFLNSSNFDKTNVDKLKLRQLEIATEWDMIEHALQNNRLWFFLTGNTISINRIEFIFNLMNDEIDRNDKYSTFRFFNNKFQVKEQKTIDDNWLEIKNRFQRFNEWFNERELYHKIGYLVCIEAITIKELYSNSSTMAKTQFRNYLDDAIKDNLKFIKLSELQYGDKNVSRVLLLYNILTMLSNEQDNSYFPFDLYKKQNWDIEHITSVKDSLPEEKNREQWIKDARAFIDTDKKEGKALFARSEKCNVKDDISFEILFKDIVSHFNSNLKDEDIDDISNLTLLDSETNRGYKNAVFPLKRKTIIDRDKSGIFIPICTKNVFLKYFSEYPPKISFWTQDDKDNYEKDIENVLKNFIKN